ncbi:N-acyl-D-amino-acid deacylase family protein [Anseongella ginsenosidimutans]|nr:D-aminoacylase [Anseongella ginsenosidimutans]QEC53811.1 D-aminoacylase [Anseongella ginsenosidimutans]
MKKLTLCSLLLCLVALLLSCTGPRQADIIIRNGMIYDGSGGKPYRGAVAITGDKITAVGDLENYHAPVEIDAKGLAVAPGFINVLSWASWTLLIDGKGESDTRQGVTLEIFGEGTSAGPLNDEMKSQYVKDFPSDKYDTTWTTLGGFLAMMENRVTPNVASFVGATTIRRYVIGNEDRPPTAAELQQMKNLVRQAMEEGALGLGTSLIYPPAFYAQTEELIEMARVAAEYDGIYISHMRNEGNHILKALDELIRIADEAAIPAQIYHLKMAGSNNWNKYDRVVAKIDSARAAGLEISANMYMYNAASTSLSATMPPWAQEGGFNKFLERLNDAPTRNRIKKEMLSPSDEWENMFLNSGGPSGILLSSFENEELRKYTGKTLEEVALMRKQSPEETAIDLIREDSSRVGAVYFMMSEENVRKQLRLPYMCFGSDAGSIAPAGGFLNSNPHPRTYGNFARLLGKYVREEQVIPLEQAIRGLTSLPAELLGISKRGSLKKDYYADVVIFDPETIQDHATYKKPHQFSTGVLHVWVNGVSVLKDGQHTGATPGRVVKLKEE